MFSWRCFLILKYEHIWQKCLTIEGYTPINKCLRKGNDLLLFKNTQKANSTSRNFCDLIIDVCDLSIVINQIKVSVGKAQSFQSFYRKKGFYTPMHLKSGMMHSINVSIIRYLYTSSDLFHLFQWHCWEQFLSAGENLPLSEEWVDWTT